MVSDDLAGALGRVNERFDLNEYETIVTTHIVHLIEYCGSIRARS